MFDFGFFVFFRDLEKLYRIAGSSRTSAFARTENNFCVRFSVGN